MAESSASTRQVWMAQCWHCHNQLLHGLKAHFQLRIMPRWCFPRHQCGEGWGTKAYCLTTPTCHQLPTNDSRLMGPNSLSSLALQAQHLMNVSMYVSWFNRVVIGLIGTKLGSPMYMLMNIKAHLASITSQSEKISYTEWIASSECKVGTSSPCCYHA